MVIIPASLWIVSLLAQGASGDVTRPPLKASLTDVAFMAGHWVGGDPGELSEEVWLAPEGGSMLGMWRLVTQGQARIYELLALTAEGEHVVLRLRHYNPKLVAREEKDGAIALALVAKGTREAVFEGHEDNVKGLLRLTYGRPSDDSLVSVLEKGGTRQEFAFKRR